ncbi:LPXTG cell wall anchor domain-containing protein [Streptomyces sp. TX20-6-3]|uniref:LPXTG cell wall anchor domain-containing protein n=1 Tax=Streptomyces sp. TX20-6-3 TaxID=3028705 RepID=UPI0029A0A777|nr:LPXTG cell wall anchor domain-containing protein [Streptomyces sp. TX20-6-3]MDX2563806.1 LPXTG cell wall anchor domain-containing protein [Streptomyces sp. TX20-6-3]
MRRSLIPAAALVAAMAGSLVLAPVASASESPTLPLHQKTPVTAAEFGEPGECKTIPADQDGWHFVIPGNGAVFTKLTVTFDNGDPIVITKFGPPKDDHAYVASAPGAELTSAVAEVSGEVSQGFFNLSHTCPATVKPTPTGTPSTSAPTPTDTPTTETPGTETPGTETPGTETPAPSETPGASETPGGTESPSASAPAGETGTGGTDSKDGDLAETGSSAPVGVLAAVAVALAGAGAFLVTRRRKAGQQG